MSQFDLFADDNTGDEVVYKLKDGHLIYYPNFFDNSKISFSDLNSCINWSQDQITLYGKTHPIPRLQAWYSNSREYSYSGVKMLRHDFNSTLNSILNEITVVTKNEFNGCLCNLYRDGRDYASWHSDDEETLGRNPEIASASFGAHRKFVLKHRFDKSVEKVEITLEDKSLLIMKGTTQHYWKHQLNKTAVSIGPRINLTFRRIL